MELFLQMHVRSAQHLWIICVVIFRRHRGKKARGRLFNLLYCTPHITPGVTACESLIQIQSWLHCCSLSGAFNINTFFSFGLPHIILSFFPFPQIFFKISNKFTLSQVFNCEFASLLDIFWYLPQHSHRPHFRWTFDFTPLPFCVKRHECVVQRLQNHSFSTQLKTL